MLFAGRIFIFVGRGMFSFLGFIFFVLYNKRTYIQIMLKLSIHELTEAILLRAMHVQIVDNTSNAVTVHLCPPPMFDVPFQGKSISTRIHAKYRVERPWSEAVGVASTATELAIMLPKSPHHIVCHANVGLMAVQL